MNSQLGFNQKVKKLMRGSLSHNLINFQLAFNQKVKEIGQGQAEPESNDFPIGIQLESIGKWPGTALARI